MKLQKLDSPGLVISRREVKEQKGKVAREVVSVEYQICRYLKTRKSKDVRTRRRSFQFSGCIELSF